MSGQPTPWGASITAQLADGAWHPLADVVDEAMRAVPPGVAYRTGERRRLDDVPSGNARLRGGTDVAVGAGRRWLVVDLIGKWVRRGSIERDGERIRRPA